MLKLRPVSAGLRIEVKPDTRTLDGKAVSQIDRIWETALLDSDKKLFDGLLFSVTAIENNLMTGSFVRYRQFLAQRREPSLFAQLRLRPLAVTGVTSCTEGIIVGCRSKHMIQDADTWELAPSGGVDDLARDSSNTVSLSRAILKELTEETGIPESEVINLPQPFLIIEDPDSHVVDIGMAIQTNLSTVQVRAYFAANTSHEYSKIDIISGAARENASPQLNPISQAILQAVKKL
ncbi:MAG: NUDIX hydrolase [Alphaproteobacteria bacterium]